MLPPDDAPPTEGRPRGWRARLAPLADRRRWLGLARDGALLLLVVTLVGAWQARDHLPPGTAPALHLRTLRGEPFALESLRGKPVLLAVWAPWCGVCRVEAGNLGWSQRLVGDRARVIVVAMAYQDAAQVEAAAREQGIEAPVLLAGEEDQAALRVEAFPTAYFLDAEGRVKRSVSGYTTTLGMVARLVF